MGNEAATRDANAYGVTSRGSIGRENFSVDYYLCPPAFLLLSAYYLQIAVYLLRLPIS